METSAASEYFKTRSKTLQLCAPLELEDYVTQPTAEASPPKWHLAHTSWFFERFLLSAFLSGYRPYCEAFDYLFNSYYQTVGACWSKERRGDLSRPTVKEILRYREWVDERVGELLAMPRVCARAMDLLELGLQHEMQHQELLLMDIKAILCAGPIDCAYQSPDGIDCEGETEEERPDWIEMPGGVFSFGAEEASGAFAYDNEKPRHSRELRPALISSRLTTNGEFLEFIEDDGYQRSELWPSLGEEWKSRNSIRCPLYWESRDGEWLERTLYGTLPLRPDWPVQHINFFEAWAYARWKGERLPSEFELEWLAGSDSGRRAKEERAHATNAEALSKELWCWTSDYYQGYPGYRAYEGTLAEYNDKFMCNQLVLRGCCFATPLRQQRQTYRNFYEPWQRWQFSGLRLAKDVE